MKNYAIMLLAAFALVSCHSHGDRHYYKPAHPQYHQDTRVHQPVHKKHHPKKHRKKSHHAQQDHHTPPPPAPHKPVPVGPHHH